MKEISRRKAMWTMIACSVLGNLIIVFAGLYVAQRDVQKTTAVCQSTAAKIKKAVNEAAEMHEKILKQACWDQSSNLNSSPSKE